jgi:hypothetical protein
MCHFGWMMINKETKCFMWKTNSMILEFPRISQNLIEDAIHDVAASIESVNVRG